MVGKGRVEEWGGRKGEKGKGTEGMGETGRTWDETGREGERK